MNLDFEMKNLILRDYSKVLNPTQQKPCLTSKKVKIEVKFPIADLTEIQGNNSKFTMEREIFAN